MSRSVNENRSAHAAEREDCLAKICDDPGDLRSRLKLARSYFLDGLHEFSVRELVEIKRRSPSILPAIEKLIAAFGPLATPYLTSLNPETAETELPEESAEDILAEIDIEADFSDADEEL